MTDAEREALRAEVEGLRAEVAALTEKGLALKGRSVEQEERAEAAEAALADLRAKVEEAHPRITLPAHHQRQPPPAPDRCRTCRQADGNLAEWPCPTMRALLEGGR
jgi:hypothetical protein